MPQYSFYIYAPTSFVTSQDGSQLLFDPNYDPDDRYLLQVTDDDNFLDGDSLADDVGEDTTQDGVLYDINNNVLSSGQVYGERFFEITDTNGNTLFLDQIEINGTIVGYSSSVPLIPGEIYDFVSRTEINDDNGGEQSDFDDFNGNTDTRKTYQEYLSQSVPCFGADTQIDTPGGPRLIGDLRAGDQVLTLDHGPQPLLWTGQRRVSLLHALADPSTRPICIRGGIRGMNEPVRALILSHNHRVLLDDPLAELMFGTSQVFVNAGMIRKSHMPRTSFSWHHLLFANHEIICANGVWVESLFTGDALSDLVAPNQFAEISQALNNNLHRNTARRCLRKFEAQLMMVPKSETPNMKTRNIRVA